MSTLRSVTFLGLALCVSATMRAEEAVAPAATPTHDPAAILRYDPFLRDVVVVPAGDVKPGYLYNRYSRRMGRRVWSVAVEGGGFLYAMGPGSVQAARQLDLRATPERQREELIAQAPELARVIDARGAMAFVELDEAGQWQLVPRPTIASIYDEQTLRRWEWHGDRRVAVVHSGGYEWLVVAGEFVPATFGAPSWSVAGHAGCW